ncbi:AmmeMemoRadiSam system radical SAM enzyme [Candidatus Woesearchaeota archaeon]|nr:AmmeMemoRadiSam system radical SAM enzyme [Candidatus Woesearchaeota archaeon]
MFRKAFILSKKCCLSGNYNLKKRRVGLKEASYYEKKEAKTVQCRLCPRNCVIKPGQRGDCRVRKNQEGVLYSMVYGKPSAINADPIEKKPQFHFLPGTLAYSIGTAGCNLHCDFCQNWEMSQSAPEDISSYEMSPAKVVEEALRNKCSSIAYTYNDPVVFFEYAIDTAKLAKKKGLKNIFVMNGFISPEPLKEACRHMDGFHVDLKGFRDKFYREVCHAWLAPVLESLKILQKEKAWFEMINLLIPGYNDSSQEVTEMCAWIVENLGTGYPLHFSRFFPFYKMHDADITPMSTLSKSAEIARKAGLDYVYVGNVMGEEANTMCPGCGDLLIRRSSFFEVLENRLKQGKCPGCGQKIQGVWR